MTKKNIFKMILLMGVGAIAGIIISLTMIRISETEGMGVLSNLGTFLIENNIALFLANILFLFFPVTYLYRKGKKLYLALDGLDEDHIDAAELIAEKHLNISLTLNGVFMIFNFMIFGSTFNPKSPQVVVVLVLFLLSTVLTSGLEIIAVNMIKKLDPRIKGDPTDLSFQKDYLNSCDEAEQLKIYKVGYHAFQTTKISALALTLVALIFNMIFETGVFPIILMCVLMLIQTISYGYKSLTISK